MYFIPQSFVVVLWFSVQVFSIQSVVPMMIPFYHFFLFFHSMLLIVISNHCNCDKRYDSKRFRLCLLLGVFVHSASYCILRNLLFTFDRWFWTLIVSMFPKLSSFNCSIWIISATISSIAPMIDNRLNADIFVWKLFIMIM